MQKKKTRWQIRDGALFYFPESGSGLSFKWSDVQWWFLDNQPILKPDTLAAVRGLPPQGHDRDTILRRCYLEATGQFDKINELY